MTSAVAASYKPIVTAHTKNVGKAVQGQMVGLCKGSTNICCVDDASGAVCILGNGDVAGADTDSSGSLLGVKARRHRRRHKKHSKQAIANLLSTSFEGAAELRAEHEYRTGKAWH